MYATRLSFCSVPLSSPVSSNSSRRRWLWCYSAQFLFSAFIQSSFKQFLAEKVAVVLLSSVFVHYPVQFQAVPRREGGCDDAVCLWCTSVQLLSSMSLSFPTRVHPGEARPQPPRALALQAVSRGERGCGVELCGSVEVSPVSMSSPE